MKYENLLPILESTVVPGGLILNSLRGMVKNQPKKSDLPDSKVDSTSTAHTLADDLVQEVALHILHNQMPDVRLNAEEDTPRTKLFVGTDDDLCFHIDPLDGTYAYVSGDENFAVGAAFSENQEFIASAVYFPALDELYLAQRGEGVSVKNGLGIGMDFNKRPQAASRFTQKRAEELLPVVRKMGLEKLDTMSAHHAMISIAKGDAQVLMYHMASPHDFGIPQVIVEEAGGICTDREGKPVCYDKRFNRVPWFFAFSDENVKDVFFEKLKG